MTDRDCTSRVRGRLVTHVQQHRAVRQLGHGSLIHRGKDLPPSTSNTQNMRMITCTHTMKNLFDGTDGPCT